MQFPEIEENFIGSVDRIRLGATKDNGGTRNSAVTVRGAHNVVYEEPVVPNMDKDIEKWEEQDGIKFLRRIGLQPNQTILDFGCRVGHYTIPAAKVVGNKGIVYALDKEQQALDELRQKATRLNLKNIITIKTSGRMKLPLESGTVDVVLFYDVLHYLGKSGRRKLYQEALRILTQDGFLSVYPKHTLEDAPMQEFRRLGVSDVKREIERSNFVFEQKHCDLISHDDGLNQGCVLKFTKYE